MNVAEPIKDLNKIKEIHNWFLKNDSTGRDAMIFKIGINSNLRASDLATLKVSTFLDKDSFVVTEKKTGKRKEFFFSDNVYMSVIEYIEKNDLQVDDYLFWNKKRPPKGKNPITRKVVFWVIKKAKEISGVKAFCPHSLRKTFGYHYFKTTGDLSLLMKIFNHSSQEMTLCYIGITQELIKAAYKSIGELYGI